MNLTFEIAEYNDFDRINQLFIEMLQTIYKTTQVKGYSKGDLDRFFTGIGDCIYVARDKDTIIAFLSIEVHCEDKLYIYLDDFSVSKSYRNIGIGSALIKQSEEYAKKIGISVIYLHVEKSNSSAIRLYERHGYSINQEQGSRYLMYKKLY